MKKVLLLFMLSILSLLSNAQLLTQVNFTGQMVPRVMVSGTSTRLPVVYRASLSNLTPNTKYRFFNVLAIKTDFGTVNPGAGNPLFMNASAPWTYSTSPSLTNVNNYGEFITDGSGNYTGWFCSFNTGNSRFTAGNYVFPSIVIGDTMGVPLQRRVLNDSIFILAFNAAAGPNNGTGIRGLSDASSKNIVALYDNVGGTGRPVSVTFAEPKGLTKTPSTAPYYFQNVDSVQGAWGTIIPNTNANGIRRIEQFAFSTGASVGFNTSSNGTWPSNSANTANPSGGVAELVILKADAPLSGSITVVVPTLTTTGASLITANAATLGGNITNNGGAAVTERGIVYATTANPTTANTKVQIGSGNGVFSQNITGLVPATLYHVRAYAINSAGTSYGGDSTFTTLVGVANTPTITSFLPLAGNVGSTVTITGTNLNNVTKVWFGSAPAASFTAVNSTTITAVVPNNAYLGNIAVATANGFTIGTKYFMVNNPQNVVIGNNDANASYYIKNGKLYGSNSYDYDGGNLYRPCLVEMPSKGSLRGKTISQISNSGIHFIALASDNTVHAWGSNFRRQLGDSSASNRSRSVEITNKGDLQGKTVIQVLAGSYTSYALSSDGQVFSWGQDTLGALGNGANTNGLVWVPTSISSSGSLAGKTIIKLSKSVAANGYSNVFAIASDGTIHAWGGNGASCLGTGNSSVAEVPVNINQSGVLAGKTIVEIEGSNNSTLLMDNDGLVYGMGNGGSIGAIGVQANPIALDMLSGSSLFQKRALAILTGKRGSYVHILDTSGALHGIGNNVFGNLGIGSTSNATRPVLVEAITSSITGKRIVGIGHGDYCVYLLASDNTLHGFGSATSLMSGLTPPNVNKAISINTLMPPTADATNISISAITQNSATISCTAGSGVGRLMVLKAFNPIDAIAPVNGINYTAAAVQPGGTSMDTSARVIYLGYGNSVNVSGLISNRLYHVAVFEYDTFASPCRYNVIKLGTPLTGNFTTGSSLTLASLITASPIAVSTTSATLGGNVTATGGATVTERGVVYATTINPTTADTKVQIGSGIGAFSQSFTGLSPATLYHVRAYAINSVGIRYGADSTFTTSSTPTVAPIVSTAKAALIGIANATLGGNVSDSGTAPVTERGVVYATSINPTTANTKVQIGSGIGAFSQNITSLAASTLYHVRAYAINSVGTSYGADSTFTTSPLPIGISNNTVTGTQNLCAGVASDTLKGSIPVGGNPPYQYLWLSSTSSAIAGFAAASGTNNTQNYLPGALVQTNWFKRVAFDGTNSDTSNVAVVNVAQTPAKPVISIVPQMPVCLGTSYLNFGASAEAPAGVNYTWSANNADLYAQGNTKRHSLISFNTAGKARIVLTANLDGCSSFDEVMVDVSTENTHNATVRYFNKNFVCEANMVNKYQWGFDNQLSLEGTIITGEINQNYFNAAPELATKNYWVISGTNTCYQKTYFNKPLNLNNTAQIEANISLYPNPSSNYFTLKINGYHGNARVELLDLNGKVWVDLNTPNAELAIETAHLAAGIYVVRCTLENKAVINTKLIKN